MQHRQLKLHVHIHGKHVDDNGGCMVPACIKKVLTGPGQMQSAHRMQFVASVSPSGSASVLVMKHHSHASAARRLSR